MTENAVPVLEALRGRESLNATFGDNALLLYALEMRFGIDDIFTTASSCLTDGRGDRKCDALYIDRDTSTAVIAQGYVSTNERPGAPSNKASDLNTAVAWVLGQRYDRMPESLAAAAQDLHAAIKEGEVEVIELWYCHNLPESANVADELSNAIGTAGGLLTLHYPDLQIRVNALEVGIEKLSEWYVSVQNPVLVADEILVSIDGWFEEVGTDWAAVCVSVPAVWLRDLYTRYGDKLFSSNVRGYMPSRRTARNINHNMETTARTVPSRFWPYNNGITALVHDYETPANTRQGGELRLTGIAIVNGAQTTGALSRSKSTRLDEAFVLARFIKSESDEIIDDIIRYNNSQNPIKASDFRSTDRHQERLRQEFSIIPDASYLGARRGGQQDRARRPSNLVPSDTAAQALAAFHGDPGVAYHSLRNIWENDELYSKYFSDFTSAEHIVFAYSLLVAIQEAKATLVQRSNSDSDGLAEDETETLAFFRQRGSQFLLLGAIGSSLEVVLGRQIPDRFALSFGTGVSPEQARGLWKPVLEVLLPFAWCLKADELRGSLRNKSRVDDAITSFRSTVRSTARANQDVFQQFSRAVTA